MKPEDIEAIKRFSARFRAASQAKTIGSADDAVVLARYYGVPDSIALTLHAAGVREVEALVTGLRYHFKEHQKIQRGAQETPAMGVFKFLVLKADLQPSGKGRKADGEVGNTGLLVNMLDSLCEGDFSLLGTNNAEEFSTDKQAEVLGITSDELRASENRFAKHRAKNPELYRPGLDLKFRLLHRTATVERREGVEGYEYRFWWSGDKPRNNWVRRYELIQNTAHKAIQWLKKTATRE